ncbi:MAG: UTP--glucose-1-phosphate uridylyltransferase GalU [Bacillota bacterium]
MKRIRKAVIPAAGLGTRFLPATKAQPKEMLPIVDKPIIQYVVEEAAAAGIQDILIITGRGKRAIEDHFDHSIELEHHLRQADKTDLLAEIRNIAEMVNIHFIRQKYPLGLGHAILQARQHVGNEAFAVMLGDELFRGPQPCLTELINRYESLGTGSVIAVREERPDDLRHYGVVDPVPVGERLYMVKGMVEKPEPEQAPSNLAMVGRYIIEPEIFDILANLPAGKNGEVQLTDGLDRLRHIRPVYAAEVEARRLDVGNKLGYLQATVEFALSREDLGSDFRAFLTQLLQTPSES